MHYLLDKHLINLQIKNCHFGIEHHENIIEGNLNKRERRGKMVSNNKYKD